MMDAHPHAFSRRAVVFGAGALIVRFSLGTAGAQTVNPPPSKAPGSLAETPKLDAWIKIDAESQVTVFTGKAELGQGIKTALLQCAAEELRLPFASIRIVTADTGLTADEGFTAGSNSMADSGTAVRNAAAQVREILGNEAARRWNVNASTLKFTDGKITSSSGQTIAYGALVTDTLLAVDAKPDSPLTATDSFIVMGKAIERVDIPAKVTGGVAYVQDIRLDNMLHARVIRPPSPTAQLTSIDIAAGEKLPGVVKVVQDGRFIAVAAEEEFQAIEAMRILAANAKWAETESYPDPGTLFDSLTKLSRQDLPVTVDAAPLIAPGGKRFDATFTRPYQMHASIGPSCAVAQFIDGKYTIWSHTQGVFPDQAAIAEMLGIELGALRVIHVEGSGCYGHNGADDAAADAALIARAIPGRPVRVHWTREQEHGWEPYGPAMVTKLSATLDESGKISSWNHEVWSNPHSTRPGPAGALLAARHLAKPFAPETPEAKTSPSGSGDRNAVPLYAFPNRNVVWHFLKDFPVRVSALRALGAYMNVFSIETFIDDIAKAAGADPVEFRLRHMTDARARDVITEAAQKFGWSSEPMPKGRGRGFAFAQYKNLASYFAIACEVEVEHESGRARMVRAVAATDAGEIVNPDGLRNQMEGGIMQSMSWTLFEAVKFSKQRMTTIDWATYPILRFASVPDDIQIHLINRPGTPFLGAGEAAQGPVAAAIGNAIANATGVRIRDLPLTRERIKAAIGI
jgi:CO/xanthine dehydrogenase Mo-binding subunit